MLSSWTLLAKAFVFAVLGNELEPGHEKEEGASRADTIAKQFLRLVQQYGESHRDLEFYADKLCITPKYLSHVISKTTGKKALKWIEDFVISKAMHILRTTDMNVNQISDSLNYLAPSDFCRTFRKNTGMTPLAYRKSNS